MPTPSPTSHHPGILARRFLPWVAVFVALTLHSSPQARANAGVFGGSGYDIELIKSNDVKMVSEDITITPGRGPRLFDGSAEGMNRVDYTCIFKLKNLRDTPVSVQVGFPLDSDLLGNGATTLTRPIDAYRFIAHDGARTYALRYQSADKAKKFRHLFVWDMTFAPAEEITLHVSYQMPLSMAAHSTDTRNGAPYKNVPEWQTGLEGCLMEWFGYVTQTGTSWADGRIDQAKFTLSLAGYDRILAQRPLIEGADLDLQTRDRLPVEYPTNLRTIAPALAEWKADQNGNLTREIADYRPTQDIAVRYYYILFPRNAADTLRLIAQLRKVKGRTPGDTFGKNPAGEIADLDALRDIFREFNGEPTGNPAVQTFVQRQVWHGLPAQHPIPAIVFETIARLKADALKTSQS